MISIASIDGFGSFNLAVLNAKFIPVVVAVIIHPSLIKSSIFRF